MGDALAAPSLGWTILGGMHISGDLRGMQLTVARSIDLSNPTDIEFFPFPFLIFSTPSSCFLRSPPIEISSTQLLVSGSAFGGTQTKTGLNESLPVEHLPMISA